MTTGRRSGPRISIARVGVITLLAAVALVGTSCSSSSESSDSSVSTSTAPTILGSITVSAASSLAKVFPSLATRFEAAHPGTSVTFNFGSSGSLATQIVLGAPTDVFAAAAPAPMAKVQVAGDLSGSPTTFARNTLEIVVKPGNPLGIHGLGDLPRAHVVALCVLTAPCGSTAAEALTRATVNLSPTAVTRAPDVDATLAQVTSGDADAAIVYVTNAATVGTTAAGVTIPESQNVTTNYPIGVIRATSNPTLARVWVAYVLGPVGTAALRKAHFLPAH